SQRPCRCFSDVLIGLFYSCSTVPYCPEGTSPGGISPTGSGESGSSSTTLPTESSSCWLSPSVSPSAGGSPLAPSSEGAPSAGASPGGVSPPGEKLVESGSGASRLESHTTWYQSQLSAAARSSL